MRQRLAGWKVNQLSLAGRITLCQSVLSALPTYSMQSAKIPIGTCDNIESFCKGFIWGDSNDQRGVHLINWDPIC